MFDLPPFDALAFDATQAPPIAADPPWGRAPFDASPFDALAFDAAFAPSVAIGHFLVRHTGAGVFAVRLLS